MKIMWPDCVCFVLCSAVQGFFCPDSTLTQSALRVSAISCLFSCKFVNIHGCSICLSIQFGNASAQYRISLHSANTVAVLCFAGARVAFVNICTHQPKEMILYLPCALHQKIPSFCPTLVMSKFFLRTYFSDPGDPTSPRHHVLMAV